MAYRVVVEVFSPSSAEYVKEQIIKHLPFLEGQVTIVVEPQITTLDKIIEEKHDLRVTG